MNIARAVLVVALGTAAAIALMLAVRARAPEHGHFLDSTRATGIFGVLATAFSVLLAFMMFLGFETYSQAKDRAAEEALEVVEQFETAELFAPHDRDILEGELICYARAVINHEWPRMREGDRSEVVEEWVFRLERSFDAVKLGDDHKAELAFEQWMFRTVDRDNARRGRLLEAEGVIPTPMWLILLLGAAMVIGYMFFFADKRERPITQALVIGTITALVLLSLLVVDFLDNPYRNESGSLMPNAMRYALHTMEEEENLLHPGHSDPPCDDRGIPSDG